VALVLGQSTSAQTIHLNSKTIKKTPLQIKLPDLFLLKHLLFKAKKNSIELKSAVMADVVCTTTSATQRRIIVF
jgi:hypothetical protein